MTTEERTALETARNQFIFETEETLAEAYIRISTAYKTYLVDNGMPEIVAEVKADEEALRVVNAMEQSGIIDLTDTNKLLSLLVATN